MVFSRSDQRLIGLAVVVTIAAAVTYYAGIGGSVTPFVVSGISLALLASLVGRSVEALGTRPAAGHERELSIVVSILLLGIFVASLPAALKRREGSDPAEEEAPPAEHEWPLSIAIAMLAITGVGAAFVSDWFVAGLTPAMDTLGISQTFAGLVIVAIAGNAVENVVGIQLAYKNQSDYALSVILQSPLQITLVIAPALVLLSPLVGASFTLVLSPLLIATLILAVVVAVIVVLDGESNWLE